MIKGLSPWDSREQSVARRRFNEPFLSNRILQRTWIFLLKWSVSVKSRYRPMRIKYLGVSHGNPKIRYWLVVSKVIKRTYNDVKPSEFWTLLLYQDLPFPKEADPRYNTRHISLLCCLSFRFPSCITYNSHEFWTLLMYLGTRCE